MDQPLESLDDGHRSGDIHLRVGSVWRSYRQRAQPLVWVYLGVSVYMSRGRVPREVVNHVWARVQNNSYQPVEHVRFQDLNEAFRVLEPVGGD